MAISDRTREKLSEVAKNRQFSIETKKRMSLARIGKKHSNETKKRMSEWQKGKKHSEEHNRNVSNALKGRKLSEITRKKMSESKKGEKCWNWQGGKSFEIYPMEWVDTLKESIRQRDDYICQECGIHQDELKRKLDVHHKDYDKFNCNPDNLISLCQNCHSKTNNNRDYWFNYFNNF